MTNLSNLDFKTITIIVEKFACYVYDFRYIHGGEYNTSYLLKSSSGEFVLKVCNEKSHEEIEVVLDLVLQLNVAHFPTNKLIVSEDGSHSVDYKGYPVILKKFIPGSILSSSDSVFELGCIIAQLHSLDLDPQLPFDHPYGHAHWFETDHWKNSEFKSWLYSFDLPPMDLPQGVIHSDIFADNVIVGDKYYLIDFEEACIAPYAMDIGMAFVGSCRVDGKLDFIKMKELLRGYLSVRHLSNREMDSLQSFTIYGALCTAFVRYRQYNIRCPDASMGGHYLEMRDIADKTTSIAPEDFKILLSQ
ncbi:MAG: phosphotransferase [Candidatus Heimdallarchaeota archaeon]|nr:phosphotransferase [Candidatus Heimdallarchaeota archaeon]